MSQNQSQDPAREQRTKPKRDDAQREKRRRAEGETTSEPEKQRGSAGIDDAEIERAARRAWRRLFPLIALLAGPMAGSAEALADGAALTIRAVAPNHGPIASTVLPPGFDGTESDLAADGPLGDD